MRVEFPAFGKIVVDGKVYDHDIVIYPSGEIERRKKGSARKSTGQAIGSTRTS